MDCAGKKNKIVAWQSGYRASQKKNCGAAINGLRRPKEQNSGAAIRVLHGSKKENYGMAINGLHLPKEQNSGAAIRVSRLPLQSLRRAWVSRRMVDTRLEDRAEGWREA